jgi:hypothetical protein
LYACHALVNTEGLSRILKDSAFFCKSCSIAVDIRHRRDIMLYRKAIKPQRNGDNKMTLAQEKQNIKNRINENISRMEKTLATGYFTGSEEVIKNSIASAKQELLADYLN